MKTITVGFSKTNALLSRLIMWATKSNVSHTYIRDGNIIFQASGLKVNEMTLRYFLTFETIVKELEIEVTDEQYQKGEEFRLATLGKPYSVQELLGFVWVLFMKAQGKKVANPLKDGRGAYICSKLVMAYLGMDVSEENVDPDELMNLLDK
jgi:hypothetical protein